MTYTHNIVQVIVYRETPAIEYLVLKRSPQDGGWWQPVTGHIESGESEIDTLIRELGEEIGVTKLKYRSEQIYAYEYETVDGNGRDAVYMVEIAPTQEVRLSDEHTEYKWVDFNTALTLLKYDGNKESFRRADQLIAEAR